MKVLIYRNRKQGDDIYDVSTPEKEAAAFLAIFKVLDEDWQVYAGDLSFSHRKYYDAAKTGDAQAAKKLILARKYHEYEGVYYGTVIDPLACTETVQPTGGK